MTFALSLPGGSEWIILIPVLFCLLASPVLAIVYYSQTRRLRRELEEVKNEKKELLSKLLKESNKS